RQTRHRPRRAALIDPGVMADTITDRRRRGRPWRAIGRARPGKRTVVVLTVLLLAGILAFALSRLGLHRIGHALASARPGWILLPLALMGVSLVLRATSWHEILRAALPDTAIPWTPVVRATMIGVMGSAVFPGRIGEPTRIVVLSRRLAGPQRRVLP